MANFSFDIVSEIDFQELDNAINQAKKELAQRYDFKRSKASIEYDKIEKKITLIADDDFRMQALTDILAGRMAKRRVPYKALKFNEPEKAFEGYIRQVAEISSGINKEKAKELVASIKKLKLKVQIQIEGEKVKVRASKKDDLQTVIAHVKGLDFSIPLSFCNYR